MCIRDSNGIVLHFLRVKHITVHGSLDVLVAQTLHDANQNDRIMNKFIYLLACTLFVSCQNNNKPSVTKMEVRTARDAFG